MNRISLLLLLPLLFSLSSRLSGQEIQVVTETWKPYNFQEQGKLKGISTEIVKLTLEKAGLSGDFKVLPWNRAYYTALTEPDTLIYTMYLNDERKDHFVWIGPINSDTNFYFYRLASRKDIKLTSLDDARRYQVGVLKDNFTHQKLLEEGFVEGVNLIPCKSDENYVGMLLTKRIDLFPGDEIATAQLLEDMKIKPGVIVRDLPILSLEANSYMAFNINSSPELVGRVEKAFEEVKKSGAIESITERYLSTYK